MDAWVSGATLTLPALVPTLIPVVLTIRWLRLGCRSDWRPGASVWQRRLVIAGFASLGLILCLIMLVGSGMVGFAISDTAEGHACSAGVSSDCGYEAWLNVVQVILGVLFLINGALLLTAPGMRKKTSPPQASLETRAPGS